MQIYTYTYTHTTYRCVCMKHYFKNVDVFLNLMVHLQQQCWLREFYKQNI